MAVDEFLQAALQGSGPGTPKAKPPVADPFLAAANEAADPFLAAANEGVETPAAEEPTTMQRAIGGAKGAAKAVGKGLLGTVEAAGELLGMGTADNPQPRAAHEVLADVAMAPVHGVMNARDVTQRALAGEDVSSSDIGEAWGGAAFGLLGPAELGVRGVKALRGAVKPGSALPAAQPSQQVTPLVNQSSTLDPAIRDLTGLSDLAAERQGGGPQRVPQNPLEVPTQLPASELGEHVVMPTELPPANRTLAKPTTVLGPEPEQAVRLRSKATGAEAFLTKNTRPGEGPWRITEYVNVEHEGTGEAVPVPTRHYEFQSYEAARDFLENGNHYYEEVGSRPHAPSKQFQMLRPEEPAITDTPQPEISEPAVQPSGALDGIQPGGDVRGLEFDRAAGVETEPLGREMTPPEQSIDPLQRSAAEREEALQRLYQRITTSSASQDVASSTLPLREASAATAATKADGSVAKLSLREELGHQAQANEQAWASLGKFRDIVEPMNDDGKLSFIHAIETGTTAELPPELQPAAETIRTLLDEARDRVQALGTGKLDHFIENYFPHMWENADEVPGYFGRRPLKGPGSFLRERTIPTTAEGIAAGLRPVTTNPLDLSILRLREMNRYVMGQRVINDLTERGAARVVPLDERVPRGWLRVNDGLVPQLAAQAPVAEVLNRYLAPGLQGNALFDAYKGSANLLNQVQLGFGAFHMGFVVGDAIVSKTALGIEQMANRGQLLKGLGSMLRAPTAAIEYGRIGHQMVKAYFGEHTSPAIKELMDLAVRGGARVRQDPFYKRGTNVEQFWKAWSGGEYSKAFGKALPALVDKIAKPIEAISRPMLDHIVPRIKLGVAADLMRYEIEQLGDGATPDALRAAAARAWDSVDNRMGQLVYDNLFWHKAIKDLGLASVRSLGWNVGTFRELGGAVVDAAKTGGRITKGGPALTHRMAYAVALPLTMGLAGGIWNYLTTGAAPEKLEDWYYPQTGRMTPEGNPERVQFPSYIRDVYEVGHGFEHGVFPGVKGMASVAKNKAHPAISLIADMLMNKDYFGNMVYNAHDPEVQQWGQAVEYIGRQFVPFSMQSAQRLDATGQSPATIGGAFFGVTPAPRSIVRTDAENLMHEYLQEKGGASATPEEADTRLAVRELRNALEQAPQEKRLPLLQDAMKEGTVTLPEGMRLFQQIQTPAAERLFKGLTYDAAQDVYNHGTPQEQRKWWVLLVKKAASHAKESGEGLQLPKPPAAEQESEAPYQ